MFLSPATVRELGKCLFISPTTVRELGKCMFLRQATGRELGKMSVPWALRQERTNEVEGEMSLCCLAVRWMVGILGTTGGTDGSYSQV